MVQQCVFGEVGTEFLNAISRTFRFESATVNVNISMEPLWLGQ